MNHECREVIDKFSMTIWHVHWRMWKEKRCSSSSLWQDDISLESMIKWTLIARFHTYTQKENINVVRHYTMRIQ